MAENRTFGGRFAARSRTPLRAAAIALSLLFATTSSGAMAQSASAEQIADLQRQLDALKAEQAQTAARIAQVENTLGRITGVPVAPPPATPVSGAPISGAVAAPAPVALAAKPASKLQLSGDVRVRYESNFGDADARNRDRGVVRARLRANYAVSDHIMAGAQLSTGDDDDPNTADVTLSNWDDDLRVSLDQIYLRGTWGNLVVHAGKISPALPPHRPGVGRRRQPAGAIGGL